MEHVYHQQDYPDLLRQISLSSSQIKEQVSSYPLTFSRERNKIVEWGLKLPMFVDSFYAFILEKGKVPAQEEAFDFYVTFNAEYFKQLKQPDLLSGIKARFFRTYPSLVRDVYFNKYIQERIGNKCEVIYNTRLDIEEGIDLMICTAKANYGICFFTQTRRGLFGRKVKEHRHKLFDNVKFVEMPMEFKGSVKAGDFFLYGEKEFNELYNLLSK